MSDTPTDRPNMLTADGVDITTLIGKSVYVKSHVVGRWFRAKCSGFSCRQDQGNAAVVHACVDGDGWGREIPLHDVRFDGKDIAVEWWNARAKALADEAAIDGVRVVCSVGPAD